MTAQCHLTCAREGEKLAEKEYLLYDKKHKIGRFKNREARRVIYSYYIQIRAKFKPFCPLVFALLLYYLLYTLSL
jgi:hypothetical protein